MHLTLLTACCSLLSTPFVLAAAIRYFSDPSFTFFFMLCWAGVCGVIVGISLAR